MMKKRPRPCSAPLKKVGAVAARKRERREKREKKERRQLMPVNRELPSAGSFKIRSSMLQSSFPSSARIRTKTGVEEIDVKHVNVAEEKLLLTCVLSRRQYAALVKGRLEKVVHQRKRLHLAVSLIQRCVRGLLARRRAQQLRALFTSYEVMGKASCSLEEYSVPLSMMSVKTLTGNPNRRSPICFKDYLKHSRLDNYRPSSPTTVKKKKVFKAKSEKHSRVKSRLLRAKVVDKAIQVATEQLDVRQEAAINLSTRPQGGSETLSRRMRTCPPLRRYSQAAKPRALSGQQVMSQLGTCRTRIQDIISDLSNFDFNLGRQSVTAQSELDVPAVGRPCQLASIVTEELVVSPMAGFSGPALEQPGAQNDASNDQRWGIETRGRPVLKKVYIPGVQKGKHLSQGKTIKQPIHTISSKQKTSPPRRKPVVKRVVSKNTESANLKGRNKRSKPKSKIRNNAVRNGKHMQSESEKILHSRVKAFENLFFEQDQRNNAVYHDSPVPKEHEFSSLCVSPEREHDDLQSSVDAAQPAPVAVLTDVPRTKKVLAKLYEKIICSIQPRCQDKEQEPYSQENHGKEPKEVSHLEQTINRLHTAAHSLTSRLLQEQSISDTKAEDGLPGTIELLPPDRKAVAAGAKLTVCESLASVELMPDREETLTDQLESIPTAPMSADGDCNKEPSSSERECADRCENQYYKEQGFNMLYDERDPGGEARLSGREPSDESRMINVTLDGQGPAQTLLGQDANAETQADEQSQHFGETIEQSETVVTPFPQDTRAEADLQDLLLTTTDYDAFRREFDEITLDSGASNTEASTLASENAAFLFSETIPSPLSDEADYE